MIVLADLEWIETAEEKYLTQLSALRVDAEWNVIQATDYIVNISESLFSDENHVALGGYPYDTFLHGISEEECIRRFSSWLNEGDVIWVWAKSNQKYLRELWRKYSEPEWPAVHRVGGNVRSTKPSMFGSYSPHAIIKTLTGTAGKEHRACDDVDVLRKLFLELGISECDGEIVTPALSKFMILQRALNREMVERTEYNYIYLKDSEVFHRRECKLYLGAKDVSDILGSIYYDTAAKQRRPCKVCSPKQNVIKATSENAVKPVIKDKPSFDTLHSDKLDVVLNRENTIYVTLINGQRLPIKRNKIVGWCNYHLHPGAVNRALLEQHDCLGKNCPYLQRNQQSAFWEERENRKRRKEFRKQQKISLENELIDLAEYWQSYLDDMDSDMYIVRVEKLRSSTYRIFYVSDNRFADGNRYPDFIELLKYLHPHYNFSLRHIKDVDGHFVTTDEYFSRRKK